MRHRLLILLAALALVMTACAEDDADETPEVTDGPTATESVEFETEDAEPTETAEEPFEESPEATETPEESFDVDETESPDVIASPTEDDGIGEDDDDELTASCEEAFDQVPDLTRIDSLQDLEDVLDGLEQTIESCESVDAWTEAAEETLNLANIDIDARQFLQRQCEDDDLEDAPLCEAV